MNIEKLRQDFPVLKKGIIYFDNACMTLRPQLVVSAINSYYNEFPACGERSEHQLGKRVTEEVEKARTIMRKFIGAGKDEEIASGRVRAGTEAW